MIYIALLPTELFTWLGICPVVPLHSPLGKHQLKLSSGLQRTFAQELREYWGLFSVCSSLTSPSWPAWEAGWVQQRQSLSSRILHWFCWEHLGTRKIERVGS